MLADPRSAIETQKPNRLTEYNPGDISSTINFANFMNEERLNKRTRWVDDTGFERSNGLIVMHCTKYPLQRAICSAYTPNF